MEGGKLALDYRSKFFVGLCCLLSVIILTKITSHSFVIFIFYALKHLIPSIMFKFKIIKIEDNGEISGKIKNTFPPSYLKDFVLKIHPNIPFEYIMSCFKNEGKKFIDIRELSL